MESIAPVPVRDEDFDFSGSVKSVSPVPVRDDDFDFDSSAPASIKGDSDMESIAPVPVRDEDFFSSDSSVEEETDSHSPAFAPAQRK